MNILIIGATSGILPVAIVLVEFRAFSALFGFAGPPSKNLAGLTHLIVETTWKFHTFVIRSYLLVNNNRNNNPNNHRYDFESTQIHSQKMDNAENGIARILFQTTV